MENDKYLYDSIGKNIKKRRKELGLTQDQLAELTNYSPSFIANIESSTYQSFSISALNNIAKILNIPLKDLLPEITEPITINVKCPNCLYVMLFPQELSTLMENIKNISSDNIKLTCPKCNKKIVI